MVGKTITATLMGAAVTQGLFDLDTPMIQYGVEAHANFNVTGIDYFSNLTARHVLAQNTGVFKNVFAIVYTSQLHVRIPHYCV